MESRLTQQDIFSQKAFEYHNILLIAIRKMYSIFLKFYSGIKQEDDPLVVSVVQRSPHVASGG